MDELGGDNILEGVEVPRCGLEQIVGDQAALHERKGVVDEAGVEPGDEAAGKRHDQDQARHDDREAGEHPSPGILDPACPGRQQTEGQPQQVTENDKGGAQVRGQSVLADVGLIRHAAFHHVPTQQPLQAAEDKGEQETSDQGTIKPTAEREDDEGEDEGDPDQAAP